MQKQLVVVFGWLLLTFSVMMALGSYSTIEQAPNYENRLVQVLMWSLLAFSGNFLAKNPSEIMELMAEMVKNA